MNNKNKIYFTELLSLFSAIALLSSTALADEHNNAKGYVTDSSGKIWRDSSGDCWHGSDWTAVK